MNLRPLLLDDKAKAAVQRVRDFAEKPENWYEVGPLRVPFKGSKVMAPGNMPEHRCYLGTYRCVFIWSKESSDRTVWRHLSISVMSKDYPHPVAAFEIATLFGLTGWESPLSLSQDGLRLQSVDLNVQMRTAAEAGWFVKIREDEHCIMIAQKIPPEIIAAKTADVSSLDIGGIGEAQIAGSRR